MAKMAEKEATNKELMLALERQAEADGTVMGALEQRNAQFCSQMRAATHLLQQQIDINRKAMHRAQVEREKIQDGEIELNYKAKLLEK